MLISEELNLLKQYFRNHAIKHLGINGFYFFEKDDFSLINWKANNDFHENLIPFGQDSNSGTIYALWKNNIPLNPSNHPIIAIGALGGIQTIATTSLRFIELLVSNQSITVHLDRVILTIEDQQKCNSFKNWAISQFQLTQIIHPSKILLEAKDQYQQELETWLDNVLI